MKEKGPFKNHILKKLIIEIRHKANLLHNEKVNSVFNEFHNDFNKTQITQEAQNNIYALTDSKRFIRIFAAWDRMGMVMENIENSEDAKKLSKKYLGSLYSKLGVGAILRIGVRSIYLIPYDGNYENLNEFCLKRFSKESELIETFGKISDSAFSYTLSDEKFKVNLTIAPLSKIEIKDKISEFKEYVDNLDQALMQDIDLYSQNVATSKPADFIENAIDAARIKFVKYSEVLLRGEK